AYLGRKSMKIIEMFGLSSSWHGRKKSTSLQPPGDFDSWAPLERQCYTSLADALGKSLPPEMRSDYIGTANNFSSKITDLRAYLNDTKSSPGGADYLFDSFFALFNRLAPEEDDLQADCENEKELIAQLYEVSKNCGPFFVTPLIVATRVQAR